MLRGPSDAEADVHSQVGAESAAVGHRLSPEPFVSRATYSKHGHVALGRTLVLLYFVTLSPVAGVGKNEIRWYGDLPQPPHQAPRERVPQRVGLFRNAKHSQVVVNDFSSSVRKAVRLMIFVTF